MSKRSKYLIISIPIIVLVSCLFVWKYSHTFTPAKWADDIDHRYRIVSDLQEKYSLIGMTEAQVIELLGQEDGIAQTSFKISRDYYPAESTLVYYLGMDIMDGMWLILPMEDGVVVGIIEDVT